MQRCTSGKSQKFTVEERQKVSEIGYKTGCHTCGTTNPGTKSGFFVPDHQPVSDLVPDGTPQKLYPQCLTCSRVQGGTTRALNSKKNVQKIKPK